MDRLAVVIVTWNVRELALDALRSVYADLERTPSIDGSVWVVDNASYDGTPAAIREHFPAVELIASEENLGFAAGNNRAIDAMGSDLPDFVLLLNPDTIVQPGALGELVGCIGDAGLAGARLVYADGSFQHSAFGFPGLLQIAFDLFPVPGRLLESRLNGRYPRSLYAGGQPFEVDHPLGATFMVRREVIKQVGTFDERFHLYCEEIDWAMRIKAAGWRALCIPTAEVIHYGGQSTGQVRPQSVINLWTARLQLYAKHYGLLKNAAARFLIRAGMNRLIRQTARDSGVDEDLRREIVNAYREVIRRTRRTTH